MADELDYQIPPVTMDIAGPYIKGADVLSVPVEHKPTFRHTKGGGVLTLKGRETEVTVTMTPDGIKDLISALTDIRVDITRTLGEPATCQVYIGGKLAFDGQDKSALFSLDGKPKAAPKAIET